MRSFRASLIIILFTAAALAQLGSVQNNAPNMPGPSLDQAKGGRVAWLSGVTALGNAQRQNDFPSAAAAPNGDIWAVWSSYSGLREEIHARRFSGGVWYTSFPIPGVSGDVWAPQVAVDGDGKPWFVWLQQVDYPHANTDRSNWDLFAARLDGDKWIGPIRLTEDPLPDINHRLIADAHGKLWLVWQGFATASPIFSCSRVKAASGRSRYRSAPIRATTGRRTSLSTRRETRPWSGTATAAGITTSTCGR